MYLVYSVILAVGMLAATPYWIFQALRNRRYLGSLRQRLGLQLPSAVAAKPPLWLHAVSVGEVLAAKPIFAAVRSTCPDVPIVVSTVTLTGQALARKELAGAAAIFYFPFDWDFCVNRFLARLRPSAVVIMETELWPNFLKGCARREIPVFLANGRISDKSVRRYRHIRRIAQAMICSLTRIGAQTQADRRRFLNLGAAEGKVVVTGNVKFDIPAPEVNSRTELLQRIRSSLGLQAETPVIVIGSSMKGEEPLFLEQYMNVRSAVPSVKLILAPRHPERFDEVADLAGGLGVPSLRRSKIGGNQDHPADILILDTIGELRFVYSLATVAVIGGSFVPGYGGHNLLEPAALGKAVVFGPDMSNFRELAALFLREQAARQCPIGDLAPTVITLLQNHRACDLLGRHASQTYRMNQGATQNTLTFLLPHMC